MSRSNDRIVRVFGIGFRAMEGWLADQREGVVAVSLVAQRAACANQRTSIGACNGALWRTQIAKVLLNQCPHSRSCMALALSTEAQVQG